MYNREDDRGRNEDHLKIQSKLISLFMVLLLLILVVVNYSLNISGPAIKAQVEEMQMILKIQEDYPKCEDFYRHSFRYVTFSASDKEHLYWFNQHGELIQSRPKTTARVEEALKIAKEYGFDDEVIRYGYGYENPVYVFERLGTFLYLDYDTLEVVYYMKEKLV